MAEKLGVIGFGTMGSEIALLGACAGMDVVAYDMFPEVLEANLTRLGKVIRMLARDPKFFAGTVADDAGQKAAIARISTATQLSALAGCTAVIEAAPEDVKLKQQIFRELAGHCGPDALLATNTSSISITEVASVVDNPGRVVGMHFFNPPREMHLVEVVPGLQTSEETVARAMALATALGKKGIRVKETAGFIVNRILMAMMNEAITLYEEGVGTIEDIDEAMKLGANFPLGPFKLADLVGLDVYTHACDVVYRELGNDKFRPPYTLRQYVRAGRLGRKTKQGFYKY